MNTGADVPKFPGGELKPREYSAEEQFRMRVEEAKTPKALLEILVEIQQETEQKENEFFKKIEAEKPTAPFEFQDPTAEWQSIRVGKRIKLDIIQSILKSRIPMISVVEDILHFVYASMQSEAGPIEKEEDRQLRCQYMREIFSCY